MTRADIPGSGLTGLPSRSRPGDGEIPASLDGAEGAAASSSTAATMFGELAGPLGPFESVERLHILETLSYGVAYEGRVFQASRSEEVCLLQLDPAFERDPRILARLLAELATASRLRDRSILSPHGVFRHDENLYVLFDAFSGVSLATAFEFLGRSGLRLSSEAVLRVASGVLTALDCAALHDTRAESAAVCHGFLTPENILIGEGQRVLVRGFGFWPAGIDALHLLGPNERRYLAPSQVQGGHASPRADLISLGILLFEALVGFPAFDAPPQEDDLAELRTSIGEQQAKAGPSLTELYEIVLAVLTAPASVTAAHRARIRKRIDTLFLREFSRDRSAKTLSLEDLIGRVKPRRPAIVKATPMSLAPAQVEAPPPISESRDASARTQSPPDARSPGLENPSGEQPAAPTLSDPPPVSTPPYLAISPARPKGLRLQRVFAIALAGAAAAIILSASILWISRSSARDSETERSSSSERAVIRPVPTAVESTSLPVSPVPRPIAARVSAPVVSRSQPSAHRAAAKVGAHTRSADRIAASARSRGGKPTRPNGPLEGDAPAEPRGLSAAPAMADVPAVAPGTLVSFRTPGLVLPVLIQRPAPLRYGQGDPRPAIERSAALEILVSDSGYVRASRILRADRLPAGFNEGIERYLAAMRFQPGQLGGVAVKVWIPFDLRFLAP